MRKLIFAISLATIFSSAALAQGGAGTSANSAASNNTSASKQGQQVNIASDTQVSAQLENSLDVKRAKPGDRVVMKTLQPIKENGRTIVPKGTRLVGHVTEVAQKTKSNSQSRLGVALDRLERGSQSIPITGSIMSVTQASTQTTASNDLFGPTTIGSSASSTTMSSASAGGRGGGLLGGAGGTLGGVTSSVGSVAGNTTSVVGNTATSTVGATTSVVGNTAGTVRNTAGSTLGTVRGLQVSPSAAGSAAAQGGSTLSLNGGNLRLENGSTLNLLISGAANTARNQ